VFIVSFLTLFLICLVSGITFIITYKSNNESNFLVLVKSIDGEIMQNYGSNAYWISFNKTLRMANYAMYNLETTNSNRCSKTLKQDIKLNSLHTNDYKYSNLDRGHLVPSKDVENSCDTFVMSNIVPQLPCFNRGIWKKVEDYIRYYYEDFDILTVPEYDYKYYHINNGVKLYIPTGFYKIAMDSNSVVCSIYLKHNFETCGKNIEDVAIFGKLPYMLDQKTITKKCWCLQNKESWC